VCHFGFSDPYRTQLYIHLVSTGWRKKRGPFVLQLVTLEVLITSASDFVEINVVYVFIYCFMYTACVVEINE